MQCKTCKKKLSTLATRTRRVNEELHKLGTTYWVHVSAFFLGIDEALEKNGFPRNGGWTDEAGTSTSLHASVGEGKWIHITWHRMSSGRYEVTAYVN